MGYSHIRIGRDFVPVALEDRRREVIEVVARLHVKAKGVFFHVAFKRTVTHNGRNLVKADGPPAVLGEGRPLNLGQDASYASTVHHHPARGGVSVVLVEDAVVNNDIRHGAHDGTAQRTRPAVGMVHSESATHKLCPLRLTVNSHGSPVPKQNSKSLHIFCLSLNIIHVGVHDSVSGELATLEPRASEPAGRVLDKGEKSKILSVFIYWVSGCAVPVDSKGGAAKRHSD